MTTCKVRHCNFKHEHTTIYHTCGKCFKRGHGQLECNSLDKQIHLKEYFHDELSIYQQCIIPNCPDKTTHTNASHMCHFCNERHPETQCPNRIKFSNDIVLDCPLCKQINTILKKQKKIYGLEEKCKVCLENEIEIYLPDCGHACICIECMKELDKNKDMNKYKVETIDTVGENDFWKTCIDRCNNTFKDLDKKIYTEIYAGMGCVWYFRRKNKISLIECFFLHSDSMGQYGIDGIDCMSFVKEFTFGYKYIKPCDPYNLFN